MLTISGDSIPVQVIIQPSLARVKSTSQHEHNKSQSYEDCNCNRQIDKQKSQIDHQNYCQQKQQDLASVYQQQLYYNGQNLDQNKARYNDNLNNYGRQNANKDHQLFDRTTDPSQQFYTLPSRKIQKEIEPPRSVTPDITRGLIRGPLSAVHMLPRHDQKADSFGQHRYVLSNEQINANIKKAQNSPSQKHPSLDIRNR